MEPGIRESGIRELEITYPIQRYIEPLFSDLSEILSDTVRCAPVLAVLQDGQYDSFRIAGKSMRLRDSKSGYFRYVINDEADIAPLTEDILGRACYIIAVDEQYEDVWRERLPNAKIRHFRLTSITYDMLRRHPEKWLPDDIDIEQIGDGAWGDLIAGMCADDEFDEWSLRQQLDENLSLGLTCKGERIGFLSTHLNGEFGPMWISPEFRGMSLGTSFLREYLAMYLEDKPIGFGLSDPANFASAKMMINSGFQEYDKHVLHITLE